MLDHRNEKIGDCPVPQDIAARLQLALIAGVERDAYVELRLEHEGRFTSAFCATKRLDEGARRLEDWSNDRSYNVFIGVCPRIRKPGSGEGGAGTDADVARAWCFWADIDGAEAIANLKLFEHPPSLIVHSGGEHHVHAYWQLSEPAPAEKIKRANRRIAYRLGADPKATNPSRILRVVGSWNVKRDRPVVCSDLELVAYRPGELVNHLPDHPADVPREKPNVTYLPGISTEERLSGPLRRLRAAAKGERNSLLYWAARVACEEADDHAEARELLRQAALESGLDEREVRGTIASAWRAVA